MEITKCFSYSFSFLCIFLKIIPPVNGNIFLSVSGRNLTLNGEKVFLSGMNQAWSYYARDFDRKVYEYSRPRLMKTLNQIKKSGGNSVSKYLSNHICLDHTRYFEFQGNVVTIHFSFIYDSNIPFGGQALVHM